MTKLMTAEEFAQYFRTTTTTVYRWLKQGKITGIKVGREWRFDEEAVQTLLLNGRVREHNPTPWANLNTTEHLMVLARSRQKVFEAEASFFQYALENGKHMMKGCWWQDPDELEEKYGAYGLDVKNLCRDGLLKIINFSWLYRKFGVSGPVESWRNEISRNRRNTLWTSGSPSLSCYEGDGRILLHFERRLNEAIRDMPIIGICPYSADEFQGERFSHACELIRHHSGILLFDGENSSLLRTREIYR